MAFDQMKSLMEMKKIQDKLKNIQIEGEEDGITVLMSASMSDCRLLISNEAYEKGIKHIEKAFDKAYKKTQKKAQEVAAQNMQNVMGNLGLPGMGGN